ncbi:MAG TPA: hypothetical protein VNU71_05250, partial [Burkholderiaceae bacterium]|nr:hypothetical protein [Burkholderiaceae bacterium]
SANTHKRSDLPLNLAPHLLEAAMHERLAISERIPPSAISPVGAEFDIKALPIALDQQSAWRAIRHCGAQWLAILQSRVSSCEARSAGC